MSLNEEGARLNYEIYTAHEHTYVNYRGEKPEARAAVGLTDGLAAVDADAADKAVREVWFPLEPAMAALDTTLETAEASQPADRNRILNTIAGCTAPAELLKPAPAAHPKYRELNSALRGRFAAAILYGLLKADKPIDKCLERLKRSGMRSLMLYFDKLPDSFNADQAALVFGSLPASVEALDLGYSRLGPAKVSALAAALPKYERLATLKCATSDLPIPHHIGPICH